MLQQPSKGILSCLVQYKIYNSATGGLFAFSFFFVPFLLLLVISSSLVIVIVFFCEPSLCVQIYLWAIFLTSFGWETRSRLSLTTTNDYQSFSSLKNITFNNHSVILRQHFAVHLFVLKTFYFQASSSFNYTWT